MSGEKAVFLVDGGRPLAVEDGELGGLVRITCMLACAYVALLCQSARLAGYHPPLVVEDRELGGL